MGCPSVPGCPATTAKRLRNRAQGCRGLRLPWEPSLDEPATPSGVVTTLRCQGAVAVRVLGNRRNPVEVINPFLILSQGSREAQQPWAVLPNRFAVMPHRMITATKVGRTSYELS